MNLPQVAPQSSIKPVGQLALQSRLGLATTPLAVRSYIVSGARQTREAKGVVDQLYPLRYQPNDTAREHLRFALKYEPLNFLLLQAAFKSLGPDFIKEWMQEEPTGQYSRRAWFLYESLTGEQLDLPAVKTGNYVDVIDERYQYALPGIDQPRYRVRDNRVAEGSLAVTIRKTGVLADWEARGLADEAGQVTKGYSEDILARAVSFLYTRETRSSFAIEGEVASANREERFFQALRNLPRFNVSKTSLISLQKDIVDPRYAANDWRTVQNFVGETTRGFGEFVHYICPKPEDVPSLMNDWEVLSNRLLTSDLDPVLAAAICAFVFVFIHPFEDGNGRIHRFLIHHILQKKGFSQPEVVLPVSTAILRRKAEYEKVLEQFSRPLLALIQWRQTEDGSVIVTGPTKDLYRFVDLTSQSEFLYGQVAEAIRVDFKEELAFLVVFDAARTAVREVVDLPDRRASLLIRLCLQNGGTLSKSKREDFPELTESELGAIGEAIRLTMIKK